MDDIKEATPCTLLYVKGRTLKIIEVANAIVMSGRIMHDQSTTSECALVEVTTIREVREFEDLDYPNEEEGIEKLKDAKDNSILWPRKNIILKTHSSMIVLSQNKDYEDTLVGTTEHGYPWYPSKSPALDLARQRTEADAPL
jgi:hypothetical protein